MLQEDLDTLLGMLPGYGTGVGKRDDSRNQRTLFHYYKDRYAIQLLSYLLDGKPEIRVDEIKNSTYARLLEKPRIKELLAKAVRGAKGPITPALLGAGDGDQEAQAYALTLGQWGSHAWRSKGWQQTSRQGVNLVLQLNFTGRHDEIMHRCLQPGKGFHLFEHGPHPVARCGRNTLGWVRLDIDLDHGEVLIEEIQNDWLRNADYYHEQARTALQENRSWSRYYNQQVAGGMQGMLDYFERALTPLLDTWAETLLSASLWFIRRELGIRRVFYHSPQSGALLKNIRRRQPPRSLYTELPRRFCFNETDELPRLLKNERQVTRLLRRQPKIRLQQLIL